MFKVLSVTQWQIPLTVILSEVIQCSVFLGGVYRGGTAAAAHSEVSPFPLHKSTTATTSMEGAKNQQQHCFYWKFQSTVLQV